MPGAPNQTQRRSARIRYANWGWSGYACGTSHLQRSHRSIAWNWNMGQWPMRVRIVQEVLALMRDPSALQPPGFIDFLPARIIGAFDHLPQGAHPLVISTKHQTIICPSIRHLTPFRKSDYLLGSTPVDVDDLAFWKRKDALTSRVALDIQDLVIHLISLTGPTKYNDSEISRPACNGKMEEGLAATASGVRYYL
ncbi:uncharacterized protein LACBIDRAFT_329361 [Laccaria bicolor S238N-H82]|uniref:Predicted protein n=1 Tax=Laccaria bicolor (strain S238N-H82 / ATCC MYA-4686) TaxID=486041 RepID=B0DHT4_LACBS|nr:uncharacterized protein LACBIDRAFT_329361 [Laccaria bicolor S238N-H82]EDR05887.1 predicted protein [Laccaria bicolor S238N-H82]|eukprot:XP_001883563.1 predicted protein [Laccaria bicolor S238N-H82]